VRHNQTESAATDYQCKDRVLVSLPLSLRQSTEQTERSDEQQHTAKSERDTHWDSDTQRDTVRLSAAAEYQCKDRVLVSLPLSLRQSTEQTKRSDEQQHTAKSERDTHWDSDTQRDTIRLSAATSGNTQRTASVTRTGTVTRSGTQSD
jgi:hypothetical protein